MSIVSFNTKFKGSVKFTGSSYDTRGFVFRANAYSGYTGSFEVLYEAEGATIPIRQATCYAEPDRTKDYVRPVFTSGATESGYTNFGFPNFVETKFLAENLPNNYGKWIPNTEPVIKYEQDSGGISRVEIDGEYTTTTRVYIVQNPEDFDPDVIRKDQPIELDAGIVTGAASIVYEGDIIYIYPTQGENFSIKVIRQKRYPQPDRTFSWTPNTSPVLTKGGYSDDELVKPGTIMIPTITTSLRAYDGGIAPPPDIPPDKILPIDYVYAGQGLVFDGDEWVSLSGVPTRLLKKDNTYGHRNEFLHTKYIDQDQPHISLVETFFAYRPIILLSAPVDGAPSGQATLTAVKPDPPDPGPEPQDLSLTLYSSDRAFFYLLYDFEDAWSRYHQANKDWRDDINNEYPGRYMFAWGVESRDEPPPGTEEPLEQFTIYAPSQSFRDGEETVVEIKDQDGNVVAGSSLSITISVQFIN